MASVEHSVTIACSQEVVFDTVADLEGMGRFSPENTGGEWLRGARGPSLGAKFKGTNAHGEETWTTTATVVAYDRPHTFAFKVTVGPVKVSTWTFTLRAVPGGTEVTESWVDQRHGLVKRFASTGVEDRDRFTTSSIETTLAKLKAHLEA